MAEAYCVKDKQKVEVQNAQKITMKNGKPALQGTCPICGGKVFKIGGCRHLRRSTRPRRKAGPFDSPVVLSRAGAATEAPARPSRAERPSCDAGVR